MLDNTVDPLTEGGSSLGEENQTGIDAQQIRNSESWYTLTGIKLDKSPQRKGLYINNGRKIVIK